MDNLRSRGSSLFPGLLLLFVGLLLLLHNYRGISIGEAIGHWWPLILIFWGGIKLYERMAASRAGDPGAAKISGSEVVLCRGLSGLRALWAPLDTGSQIRPARFQRWGNGLTCTWT